MVNQAAPSGILAIWNDCAAGREAVFENWYRTEHLAERLAIPGFRLGRRFCRLEGSGPQFFTWYRTDDADVLFSAAYRARVDNPTPLTRQAMSGVFINVSRTICNTVRVDGEMHGAFAVTMTSDDRDLLARMFDAHPATGPIVRAEIWSADPRSEGRASTEQALRGPDSHIGGCLLIETATAAAASEIARQISRSSGIEAHSWSLMYELAA